MREVDGILDFLEEHGLFRPPVEEDQDPRVGSTTPEDQIVEIDWEALVTPDFMGSSDFSRA